MSEQSILRTVRRRPGNAVEAMYFDGTLESAQRIQAWVKGGEVSFTLNRGEIRLEFYAGFMHFRAGTWLVNEPGPTGVQTWSSSSGFGTKDVVPYGCYTDEEFTAKYEEAQR